MPAAAFGKKPAYARSDAVGIVLIDAAGCTLCSRWPFRMS